MATLEDDDGDDPTSLAPEGIPNPSLEDCPVAILGSIGDLCVFAMPEGDIRMEKARDIIRLIKSDIFNRIEGKVFLLNWRDPLTGKFHRELAAEWFIRKCREAGYWDRSRPQRALGVWPGRRRGQVLLHRGQELVVFEDGRTPVRVSVAEALRDPESPIYQRRAARPAPADPATIGDGDWLRRQLDAWHFESLGAEGLTGADALAGWIGASLMGAVAPFRPHALVYALMGSGKTTLVRFVHACLSALAGDVIDNFTAAGLANDLAGMARPVIIDEAEASAMPLNGLGPVEQALELIRRMATGAGAVKKMGTIGGGAVTQTAVGSVLMAAINPVALTPADASRIVELRLFKLEHPAAAAGSSFRRSTDAELTASTERAEQLAPAFLGRALSNATRYLSDVATLKPVLIAGDLDSRAADLIAALAAGRRLLLCDRPLDPNEAEEEASFWCGLVEARAEREGTRNDGREAFARLMTTRTSQHSQDRIVTIGELVDHWVRHPDSEDAANARKVLGEYGLRVDWLQVEHGQRKPFLFVAYTSPRLKDVFVKTAYADYVKTLGFLDDLGEEYKTRKGGQKRFSVGLACRSLAIPLDPWLEPLS